MPTMVLALDDPTSMLLLFKSIQISVNRQKEVSKIILGEWLCAHHASMTMSHPCDGEEER
jgi:hypothetical protein